MRRKKYAGILFLVSVVALAFLTGCGQEKNGDILEEPEITVEYLSGEYADQILRDGGEKELGAIRIKEEKDGKYALTVESMVIVESSYDKDGYYVADKNLSTTVPLDSEARVTYIKDKKKARKSWSWAPLWRRSKRMQNRKTFPIQIRRSYTTFT